MLKSSYTDLKIIFQEIQTIPRLRKWEMSREAENVPNHCNTHLLNKDVQCHIANAIHH